MLESAVSSVSDALDFYTHLRRFDLTSPQIRSALAFARTCRELLLRVSAAWRCQQGFLAEAGLQLPSLAELFDLRLEPNHGVGRSAAHPTALLWCTARWFAELYDPAQPAAASYQVWVGPP